MNLGIITCVRKENDSYEMRSSFGAYEYDCFERVGCRSMGEGYNQPALYLVSEILMFVHSDVIYWGSGELIEDACKIASRSDTGFVGVAGRVTDMTASGMWWDDKSCLRGSVTHDNLHGGVLQTTNYGPYGQVQVLDGVLLMCHRRVFDKIGPWDESLGWHFYDLDITLRAHKAGLKNYAVPLPILHKGLGTLTPEWEASKKLFLEKHGIV